LESAQPSLLPVTCGYFYNIVRQLLAKARKQTMRYLLLDCEGRLFDKLVDNISHHSLSDLLVEMMQLNFPAFQFKMNSDDLDETNASDKDTKPEISPEQKVMVARLRQKKDMVIGRLLNGLTHSNRCNIEVSLNSSTVLVELIEIEKTFEFFFLDNCRYIRQIIELAIDPSNEFNQKYLLHILVQVVKNLKP